MEKLIMKKYLLGTLLSLFSCSVFAHSGHGGSGFFTGFSHPFLGMDHVLVMLAIGFWAGKAGGSARWQLPLTFVIFMAVSAVLAISRLPALELALAGSVMAMGLLVALNGSLPRSVQLLITALVAMLHGWAHGIELPVATGSQMVVGMLLATALLLGLGVLLAARHRYLSQHLQPLFGGVLLLAGSHLLVASW
jgi:urease accessory protein